MVNISREINRLRKSWVQFLWNLGIHQDKMVACPSSFLPTPNESKTCKQRVIVILFHSHFPKKVCQAASIFIIICIFLLENSFNKCKGRCYLSLRQLLALLFSCRQTRNILKPCSSSNVFNGYFYTDKFKRDVVDYKLQFLFSNSNLIEERLWMLLFIQCLSFELSAINCLKSEH